MPQEVIAAATSIRAGASNPNHENSSQTTTIGSQKAAAPSRVSLPNIPGRRLPGQSASPTQVSQSETTLNKNNRMGGGPPYYSSVALAQDHNHHPRTKRQKTSDDQNPSTAPGQQPQQPHPLQYPNHPLPAAPYSHHHRILELQQENETLKAEIARLRKKHQHPHHQSCLAVKRCKALKGMVLFTEQEDWERFVDTSKPQVNKTSLFLSV